MALLGKKYRGRVHASKEDVGTVPLNSIQTDDFQEFMDFVLSWERQGFHVDWSSRRKEREAAEFFLSLIREGEKSVPTDVTPLVGDDENVHVK